MSFLKVHTAQNVLLDYQLGNVGQRVVAGLLDLILVILYIILTNWVMAEISTVRFFEDDPDILFFFILVLPVMLYLPVSEYLWNGRTVGKAILRMRVVRIDGSNPSLGDIVLRWLLRTIDVKLGFLMIFFVPSTPTSDAEQLFLIRVIILMIIPLPIVGIVSMALSSTCQRIGDRVANTTVIISKRPYSLDDTILKTTEDDYEPVYPNVLKLRDKDIYIIKNALDHLDKTGDYGHIGQLGAKAKEILEIEDDIKPLFLLRTLIKDYNHLSRINNE